MVTEDVKPLNQVVHGLFPIQICIGLRNILNALLFLREMVRSARNQLEDGFLEVWRFLRQKISTIGLMNRYSQIPRSVLSVVCKIHPR